MHFHMYLSGGQWRWRLVAADNRVIAKSGESYLDEADCLKAIQIVKDTRATPVYESPPSEP